MHDRIAAIVREHEAARAAAGITTRTRTTRIDAPAVRRGYADIIRGREHAVDDARRTERERHAESARLARRMGAIVRAIDATDDDERRARLTVLLETVTERRERYQSATWAVQATEADWTRGGRFWAYARRFDLGFIAYDPEDIVQEAAELLAGAHEYALLTGAEVLPQGERTATGSRTMPHTIGDGYRAIRSAYRRGLGFYGYERRGKVVERDALATRERADGSAVVVGYTVHESSTVADLRHRGADESSIRATVHAQLETLGTVDIPEEWIDPADVATVQRRRNALATLARRFPLNADGRMLALATLLAEGYTIGELTDGLELTETTLNRWANELGSIIAA